MKLRDDYTTNEYFLKLFAGRYEDLTPVNLNFLLIKYIKRIGLNVLGLLFA